MNVDIHVHMSSPILALHVCYNTDASSSTVYYAPLCLGQNLLQSYGKLAFPLSHTQTKTSIWCVHVCYRYHFTSHNNILLCENTFFFFGSNLYY